MAAARRFNSATIALGLPSLPETPFNPPTASTSGHTTPHKRQLPAHLPSPPITSPASSTGNTYSTMDATQVVRFKKPSRQMAPVDEARIRQERAERKKKAARQQKLEKKEAAKAAAEATVANGSTSTAETIVSLTSGVSTTNIPAASVSAPAGAISSTPTLGNATPDLSDTDVATGSKRKRNDSGFDPGFEIQREPGESSEEAFHRVQMELLAATSPSERRRFGLNHKVRKSMIRAEKKKEKEAAAAKAVAAAAAAAAKASKL